MRYSLVTFILLASGLTLGSAQRYAERFKFLPVNSEDIWGIHLRGPANKSYNEWNAQAPLCEGIYNGYLAAVRDRDPLIGDYIYNVSECILESSSVFQAQTIQAAGVLMGLAPILLSATGPTLTELALISVQRPVLAVLFSLGTAAVYSSRTLSFYDDLPRDVIGRCAPPTRLLKGYLRSVSKGHSRKRMIYIGIGLLEYTLAMGAVYNTMYTSWQVGIRTISVLNCTASWYPLFWGAVPLLIHAIMCGAFHRHFSDSKRIRAEKGKAQLTQQPKTTLTSLAKDNEPSSSDQVSGYEAPSVEVSLKPRDNQPSLPIYATPQRNQHKDDELGWEPTRLEWHILPSSAHDELPAELLDKPSTLVDLAHKLGTILGFAQVISGTIIFASILFISEADAAMILLRYLLSVVVCRTLVALELGGMEAEGIQTDEDEQKPSVNG